MSGFHVNQYPLVVQYYMDYDDCTDEIYPWHEGFYTCLSNGAGVRSG